MRPRSMSLVLASMALAWCCSANLAAAQEQDLVAAAKKLTGELAAADKVFVSARNNLAAAQRALDVTVFNSASYNAKVTADQVKATKDNYDKAEPEEKEDALEVYELAQELAAQRKTALEAAKKLLPQREAEAKAAEDKYSTVRAAAETMAAQLKSLVRQTESDAEAKLRDSKLAIEKAAFSKATAEQKVASDAVILKTITDLVAADNALQQAAAAVKQAAEKDRPQKLTEAENATKAYASALHVVVQHLPSFAADQSKPVILELSTPLVEADRFVQTATAAVQRVNQDITNRTNAVKQAQTRIKAAQQGVEKRIAKIRARKDLAREQEAGKRAEAAKLAAEQALPPKAADLEKAQQAYAASLQAAVKTFIHAPEAEKLLAAEEAAAIAKAAVDKAAADKTSAEKALAGKIAAAQKAATELAKADQVIAANQAAVDKAGAEKTAAEKALAEKTAAALAAASAVAAEKDPVKKTAAQEAATKAASEKAAAEKTLADKVAAAPVAATTLASTQRSQASVKAAAERAAAEKTAAEKLVAAKASVLQKATADLATANAAAAAAKTAAQRVATEKTALAKAMADKEAELKKENEVLASQAAGAQGAADKALADLAAVEKLVVARVAARQALDNILRQRFYRDASAAQNELRQHEAALAAANRQLQPKVEAFNKATTALKQATDGLVKAQQAQAAQATALASATKAKTAAETAAKEKEAVVRLAQQKLKEAEEAARPAQEALKKAIATLTAVQPKAAAAAKAAKDAEQRAAAAKATLDKATADKTTAEQLVSQHREALDAAPVKVATAKAAAYGGLKLLPDSAWDYAKARHLMVRAGFGGTPDEVAALHAMGLHRAVDHLVNFKKQPDAEIDLAAYPKERPENYESALSSTERRRLQGERVAQDRQQIQKMRMWWLRRMIESPRPLEEKLTLFWHGQIPAQYSDVGDSYYMYLQNQLFRNNAAGNFATLLHGIAHDGAMLKYLNNDTNVKGKANENLAREIIELFSMGRDQGYDENDIRQGARALTGYTYDAATGQFRFVSSRHDTEPKTIFGKTGNWNGDDYARLILETPYPAKFVARRMFMFFVHAEPSIDDVESMARILRLNNYELTPMLENLFLSEEFYSAKAMSTEVKSPVQLIVGLHRDLGLENPDYAYLATALRTMDQDLFEPPSVFGWQPGRSWITTSRVLSRYNVLAEILERRPRGGKTGVDVLGTLLAGKKFKDHGEVVDHLVKCCWMVPLSETKKQALLEYLKPLPEPAKWSANAGTVNSRLTHLLVMLMCSPEYQLS